MGKPKKIISAVMALAVLGTVSGSLTAPVNTNAAYGVGGNGKAVMEYLDRGIYAVKSGNGMFVSWRYNANDADDAEFRLYRDDKLVYTSKSGDPTCFQDNGGTASSKYRVNCIEGGKTVNSQTCKFASGNNYFDIKLNSPGSQYSPNDCAVGDVDGDGQYEIFLKWDPSNAKDNSQSGKTDKVYIDCYTLEGKQLWRIDMGQNIRAGQHYTQMCVADFDCDGKAELITKTADGTKDGKGKVLGDGSKSYANGDGYILDGAEFLTLFDGQTGAALDTIDFPVPRGKVADWGDKYGNRVDRYNSGIAYLDGVHPTALYGRGYYTRLTWSAVDVQNKKLVKRWVFDSNNEKSAYSNGNHNVMVADVDNDGKQEVFTGAACIDDNGKLLWANGKKHGDAMHLGDLDPSREGMEAWVCHEETHGMSLLDAKTGQILFHVDASGDTGRCAGDNIWSGNKGAELWGAADGNMYNTGGKQIGSKRPAMNFFIYWDGDLEREILDGNKISKMTAKDTFGTVFTATGCASNNGSKSVPCLTADLFGDWREELILRTEDNTKLRIWCTTNDTKVRLTTLMHDMQYRMQNGCEQSCYNQPPHPSYYLGSDTALPARPKVLLNNTPNNTVTDPVSTETTVPVTTAPIVTQPQGPAVSEITDGQIITIRNVNSGLYLAVEGGIAGNGANVQQSANVGKENQFKAVSAGDGYFYLISQLGDGNTYALDITAKKPDDGTNIELYTFKQGENQKFRFLKNDDGTFSILTKLTGDVSCLDVDKKSKESGANIQQYTFNGGINQKFVIEGVSNQPSETTTAATSPQPTEIKTETVATSVQNGNALKGDANCSGTVDISDAVAILQYLANASKYPISAQGLINADVDGQSGITGGDALVIQQYDAGAISSLPITK